MADADVWSSVVFRASFAGLTLDILSTRDTFRRSLAKHEYPNRDGARIQDMGGLARVCESLVIFYERAAGPEDPFYFASTNHLQRAEAFVNAAQIGQPREFVHPLFGTFPALVENLDVSAVGESRDQVSVMATFIEQGLDPTPLQAQLAKPIEGGAAAVAVDADLATQAAAASMPPADAAVIGEVASDATATVDAWDADPDVDPRAISIGLQKTSDAIDDAIRTYDLAGDPSTYAVYRSLSRLHYQVKRAAARARRDAPALIRIVTASAAPLRVILADTYGARDADAHFVEVMRLNRIPDPLLVDGGSTLTVPTPAEVNAQRTRRAGPAYGR